MGNISNIIDNSNINLVTINPFNYRSYYYDGETKLYYLNSRYYDPRTGRFINADGIINSNHDCDSNNLFQYCSNNFINRFDYIGEFSLNIGTTLWSIAKTVIKTAVNIVKKVINSNGKVCKNIIDDKPKVCETNITTKKTSVNVNKGNSISRPSTGTPNGVYDIPNGDYRIMGPFGDLKNAKDFDESHPEHHPDLENPHIHDFDEFGKRSKNPRNPTPEEKNFYDNHKKEIDEAAEATAKSVVIVGGLYVGYQIVKWGIAIITAPSTAGGSLVVARATP